MGPLILLLTAALWGTAFVAQKAGADSLGPFAVQFARSAIAALVLYSLVAVRERLLRRRSAAPCPSPFSRRLVVAGGLCGVALFFAMLTQQVGIAATTPGVSAFLTANYILIVPVLGLFLGCKTNRFVWLGVALALAGTYFICIPANARSFSVGSGEAWTILCAFLFSVQILLVDRLAPGTDIFAFSCVQQVTSACLAFPFVFTAAERAHYLAPNLTAAILPLLYLGVVSSGVAYTCQNIGQMRTPPALASVIMSLESVFGVLAGYVFLGDRLTPRQLIGSALLFAAVLLAQLPNFLRLPSPGPSAKPRRLAALAPALAALLALAMTACLFACGVTDGHLCLDDWGYTAGCPFVRSGLSLANLRAAFADFGYGAIWMPVTFASYMLDTSLFGASFTAYHATNVALHLLNAVLVGLFLRRLLAPFCPDRPNAVALVCVFCALLWAVHPLRAEAVSYVAGRKEELWTLFSLLGLLAYDAALSRPTPVRGLAVFACFALAALSKPTAVCFPLLAAALAFARARLTRRVLLGLVPFFLGALCLGLIALHSQAHPSNGAEVDLYEASLSWRLLNAAVSVGLSLAHVIAPHTIHFDYRAVFGGMPVNATLGLAALALATLAALFATLRLSAAPHRLLLAALALYLFSLAPTLGLFGSINGDQAMADRYSYFPDIALALLLALALLTLLRRVPRVLALLALALPIALAFLALPVIRSFSSDYAAFSRVLVRDPSHWRALRVVGAELCARHGRMSEGVTMLRRSLALRASQRTADALAYVLALRNGWGDSAEVLRLGAAVMRDMRRDEGGLMLDALGLVHRHAKRHEAAVRFFEASLRAPRRNHAPDHTWLNLGLSLSDLGRVREARAALARVAFSPDREVSREARAALAALRSL